MYIFVYYKMQRARKGQDDEQLFIINYFEPDIINGFTKHNIIY